MTSFWDDRYSENEYMYGKNPNAFLVSEAHKIPKGRILCLAEGEGRNAVFLAEQGYEVTAIDQSSKGLEKVTRLAHERGVKVDIILKDLADFSVETDAWDGIVSIFVHVPPSIRKPLHEKIVKSLKPGGVILLEAFTEKQLDMPGYGGPPLSQRELFMSLPNLKEEFAGLDPLLMKETQRTLQEGKLHNGPSALVQFLAKRQETR